MCFCSIVQFFLEFKNLLDLMNLKSTGIDRLSRNYYVKFQVFPIRGFRFIALTYTPTYAHCDKVIAISTPPYYVVGADNNVR